MSTHHFSRRAFLRGVGVTMALPWLESFNVWGDELVASPPASEAPVRLAVLFAGNGFHSKELWAKGEGRQMELGKVLAQRIVLQLESAAEPKLEHDSSTNALIRRYRKLKGAADAAKI